VVPRRRAIPERSVVTVLLRLVVERGWRHVSLLDVARAGGFALADLHAAFPSKEAVLTAFSRELDRQMLAEDDAAADLELPRERLLDVVLRRFDAMASYREPVRVLMRDLPRDPMAMARLRPAILGALGAMLEGAGLDSSGLRGAVRRRVLGMVFLQALRVWVDDDGADLSRTTAELDRRLRRAGGLIGAAGPAPRPSRDGSDEPGNA
jgi:AcrR family transcriptional regulator